MKYVYIILDESFDPMVFSSAEKAARYLRKDKNLSYKIPSGLIPKSLASKYLKDDYIIHVYDDNTDSKDWVYRVTREKVA